jgi:membrane dipeptidase
MNKISEIHKNSIIIDGHSDYAIQLLREKNLGNSKALKDIHLPELQKAGVNLETMMIGGDFDIAEIDCKKLDMVLQVFENTLKQIEENEDFNLIKTKEDLNKVNSKNLSFILGIEGVKPLGENIETLEILYRLGLRTVILTHNERNFAADGCAEKANGGLSKLGISIVKKINDLNIIPDLVHVSERSFFDAAEILDKPFVVSHSNAKAVCNHYRNLTDEQIKAVASAKGVIGINFLGLLVDEDIKNATIDRLIDHIVYIANLIGIEHIGLGPDFANYYADELKNWVIQNGYPLDLITFVKDLEDVAKLPNLTEKMLKRGFSEDEIKLVLGKNFLRVYSEIL